MHTQPHDFSHDAQHIIAGDVLDQFYAPVQFDALTLLASEHIRLRERIIEVHGIITQENVSGVMGFFFKATAATNTVTTPLCGTSTPSPKSST